MNLYDLDAARERRDRKIGVAYGNAQQNQPALMALAEERLPDVAARHEYLIGTDELLADVPELEGLTNKRALANVLLRAAKDGLIERTGSVRTSPRRSCNARKKTEWRSLVYRGES